MTVTHLHPACLRCRQHEPRKGHGLCRPCYDMARQRGWLPSPAVKLSDSEREARIDVGWRALLLAISEDPGERTGGDRRNLVAVRS